MIPPESSNRLSGFSLQRNWLDLEGQCRKAKAQGEYPNTKAAVFIDGKSAGSIFYLCQTEKCDVHNRVTRYQPTLQEQAQRKKEALAERVEKPSRVRILEAIRGFQGLYLQTLSSRRGCDLCSLPARLVDVALDYFRRLGHDNHRRLSKLYAWEEKKSKTSWGAQTVDYEKIATAAAQAMKAPDPNRFLRVSGFVLANPELTVSCDLASDLYCPGYNPKQSLAKDSNLALTAARYKIDSIKTAKAVRAELSGKKPLSEPHKNRKRTAAKT